MTDYENKVNCIHVSEFLSNLFLKNSERFIEFDLDCIVPDSIENAPANGWSTEWMH